MATVMAAAWYEQEVTEDQWNSVAAEIGEKDLSRGLHAAIVEITDDMKRAGGNRLGEIKKFHGDNFKAS